MNSQVLTFAEQDLFFIMKTYPKTYKKLTEYITDIFSKSEGEVPSAKDIDGIIPAIILFHPRTLYDFFDTLNIKMGVRVDIEDLFESSVDSEALPTKYHTRQEAEKHGFLKAFEIAENESTTSINNTAPSGGSQES